MSCLNGTARKGMFFPFALPFIHSFKSTSTEPFSSPYDVLLSSFIKWISRREEKEPSVFHEIKFSAFIVDTLDVN